MAWLHHPANLPAGIKRGFACIELRQRDAVNALVDAGAAAGGKPDVNPPEDHGFMFQRTICDPDDHVWEPFWMDQAAALGGIDAQVRAE